MTTPHLDTALTSVLKITRPTSKASTLTTTVNILILWSTQLATFLPWLMTPISVNPATAHQSTQPTTFLS